MLRRFVRLCLVLILGLSAQGVVAQTWPTEQWSSQPVPRSAAIEELEAYAFPPRDEATRKGIRTDALLVIRDGEVVYERYAGVTNAQTPHLTWSISKSIMATVLGVAFTEGRFQLSDPVAKFYAPFQSHPDITLTDLMHWASGLDWQEDYEYAPLNSSVVAMLYTRGVTTWRALPPSMPQPDRRARRTCTPAATARCWLLHRKTWSATGVPGLSVDRAVRPARHSQCGVGNRRQRHICRFVLCLHDRARSGTHWPVDAAWRGMAGAAITQQGMDRFCAQALRRRASGCGR